MPSSRDQAQPEQEQVHHHHNHHQHHHHSAHQQQHRETYFYTRTALLRMASFVFFAAFAVAFFQNEYLIGERGLLPANIFLDRVSVQHRPPKNSFESSINIASSQKSSEPNNFEIEEWCEIANYNIFYKSDSLSTTSLSAITTSLLSSGMLPSFIDDNFIVRKSISSTIDSISCFLSRKLLRGGGTKSRSSKRGGLPSWKAFKEAPTLLWWAPQQDTSLWLNHIAWTGMILNVFIFITGAANSIMMFIIWALYFSIVAVGQNWHSFGWESQLLETAFILIFCVPFFQLRDEERNSFRMYGDPTDYETGLSFAPRYLLRFLLFRIMIGAGLIKLRADPCWRDLTCMNYHYETQPVPNPLSILFHSTPPGFHRIEVVANHVNEIVAPCLLLFPFHKSLPLVGGVMIVIFMTIITISGNFVFLNWLTMIPAFACFPDSFWHWMFENVFLNGKVNWLAAIFFSQESKTRILDHALLGYRVANNLLSTTNRIEVQNYQRELLEGSRIPRLFSKFIRMMKTIVHLILFVTIFNIATPAINNLLSNSQRMNDTHHWLRIVNSHGNFGSITKDRPEIIIQGRRKSSSSSSSSLKSNPQIHLTKDDGEWKTYEFFCKPTNKSRTPCLISPYHYRLDWIMWFAGFMGGQQPHTAHLFYKMLKNDETLLENLIAYNPFGGVATNKLAETYAGPEELRVFRVNYKFNIFNSVNKNSMGMIRFRNDWDWRPFFFTLKTWFVPEFLWPVVLNFEKHVMGYEYEVEKFRENINIHRHWPRPDIWKEQGRKETLLASVTLKDLEPFVKQQLLKSPITEDDEDEDDVQKNTKKTSQKMKFEQTVGKM